MGGEYSVIGVPVHTLNESSSRAFVYTRLEVYTANNVFHAVWQIKGETMC